MKYIFLILLFCFVCQSNAQQETSLNSQTYQKVYHWDKKQDNWILGGSAMMWASSRYIRGRADKSTIEDLNLLDAENVWSFDRGAILNESTISGSVSDAILIGSIILPFSHYASKKARDEQFAILGMTFQAFFISDGIANILKASTKRFRPYAYNPSASITLKLSDQARYSFVSGHTSNTATLCFFSAKVFSDLYPESKWKPFVWTAAVTLPALAGYMRFKAGRHFPTDILAGYGLGAAVGYLVPHFHKISNNDMSFNLIPLDGGLVFSFQKRLY